MHFYGLGYEQIMSLPLSVFWMLNQNVERLRADSETRTFHVYRASQAESESANQFYDHLVEQVGQPIVTRLNVEKVRGDVDAKRKLESLFG